MLILSAEDGLERMHYRLHQIVRELDLTDADLEKLGTGLLLEDLTGHNARLVESDKFGNLSHTALVDHIIETYRGTNLSLLVIDPAVFFGPGERFVNDGEAALTQVAARLRRELRCAVIALHHVGKANARAGTSDQYAGRGGSALADGMRFVWTLVTHRKDDEEHKAPLGLAPATMAEGRLLRLHVAKLTDGPAPTEPIWILRTGFKFERVLQALNLPQDRRKADLQKLCAFLRDELERGVDYSQREIEDEADQLGMGRNALRSLVKAGLQLGDLVYRELPPEKKPNGGRRTHYLDPGPEPEIDLEVRK